jgi:hypothetical protein
MVFSSHARVVSLVALVACCGQAFGQVVQPRTQLLAITGQEVPGQSGAQIGAFLRATSDGTDAITISAGLNNTPTTTNNAVLRWDEASGTWQTVVRKGSVSGGSQAWQPTTSMIRGDGTGGPGAAGQVLVQSIVQPFPTPDLIPALLRGPTTNPEGWVTVVRARTPSGVGSFTFSNIETGQINAQAEVLFRSTVTDGTPNSFFQSYWLQRGSSRQLLLRTGTNLPGSLIETIGNMQSAAIGDATQGVTPVVVGLSTLLTEGLLLRGDVDANGDVTWTTPYRATQSSFGDGFRGGALLSGISMGYAGWPVALVVEQKTNAGAQSGEALLRADAAGVYAPIARSGQPAGGGRTFTTLEAEAPAVFGRAVAFRASARVGNGPAQSGIWWQNVSNAVPLQPVVIVGEPVEVEGLPAGLTWSSLQPPRLGPVSRSGFPLASGLAFSATIAGPGVTSANNTVACIVEPADPNNPAGGTLARLVAREGQSVSLPGGGAAALGEFGVAGRGVTESLNQTGVTGKGVLLVGSLGDGRNVLLRVSLARECASIDFNEDGLFPDDSDLIDFLAVLAGGACSNVDGCRSIDFNGDGLFPDDNDLLAFLCALAGGATCCE